MFNHSLTFHQLKMKLKDKLDEKVEIINQEIHIRDIYIYPATSETHGERMYDSIYQEFPY